jgi:hypothetical protein
LWRTESDVNAAKLKKSARIELERLQSESPAETAVEIGRIKMVIAELDIEMESM